MNHYQILGVAHSAGKAEIRDAYRELVKKYHPDINPAPEAAEQIRRVNEAYEVLSDYHSRNAYDLSISGAEPSHEHREPTEGEKYRRDYLRRKAHLERIRIERLVKLKFKLYRIERVFCALFFIQGILYTLDYYILPFETGETIERIRSSDDKTRIKTALGTYQTDIEIHYESRRISQRDVIVIRSAVFKVPARIRLKGSENEYRILKNLHSFYNIFSVIILAFSAVVINNKDYTDFRLTCGIVPAFLSLFLILYVFIKS